MSVVRGPNSSKRDARSTTVRTAEGLYTVSNLTVKAIHFLLLNMLSLDICIHIMYVQHRFVSIYLEINSILFLREVYPPRYEKKQELNTKIEKSSE